MVAAAPESNTTLREQVCDLARDSVIGKIDTLITDRMDQGETLEDLLTGTNDQHDDEVFNLYETYLRRIRGGVKNLSVHL